MELEKKLNDILVREWTDEEGDVRIDFIKSELIDLILPFKVATEDSPEVLEKPIRDLYKDIDGVYDERNWKINNEEYDKAPLISRDRLELNKLRVENERLKKSISERLEYESMRDDVIISINKQLKEQKEVIDYDLYKLKAIEDVIRQARNIHSEGDETAFNRALNRCKKYTQELLSKLNKD